MRKFQITYVLIGIFGILFSILAFLYINFQIREKNISRLDYEIEKSQILIKDELSKIQLVLKSMEIFHKKNDSVLINDFNEYTTPYIEHLPGIQALEWAPIVYDTVKDEFINTQQKLLDKSFTITQKSSKGGVIDSKNHSFYYPVQFINPIGPNYSALGYNLYSNQSRKLSIDKTLASGRTTLTPPIKLVQINDNTYGFLSIKSVLKNGRIKGVVLGVYNMDKFIRNTLTNCLSNFKFNIYDIEDNYSKIFSSEETYEDYNSSIEQIERNIKIHNRTWKLVYKPRGLYNEFPHSFESYVILFLGLMVTSLIMLIIIKGNNYQKSLEMKVSDRTLKLKKVVTQKEILLKEIHHRVKNSLQIISSIIRLQKSSLSDDKAIQVLESSESRISAISMVHKLLYHGDNLDSVYLDKYLNELITNNIYLLKTKIFIDSPEIEIHIDIATPISLIINELISNSIKHAFPSPSEQNEIKIIVETLEFELIKITISDNGKGFPEDFNFKSAHGLGLEIIAALSEQIEAETKFSNSPYGAEVTILINNKTNTNKR